MKILSLILIVIGLRVISVEAQSLPVKLADLTWLAGCWEASNPVKGSLLSEQWMRPEGGLMIGMGRTVHDHRAQDWEFMRIEQRGDSLTFFARPKANKDETSFDLLRMNSSEVVFENLQHDFPQRVIYRFVKPDSLAPRIEGMQNGKLAAIEFTMKRVKCNG